MKVLFLRKDIREQYKQGSVTLLKNSCFPKNKNKKNKKGGFLKDLAQ